MQKKLDHFYNSEIRALFKPLVNWQFPKWPDTLIGCFDLLQEQSQMLIKYIIPLKKLIKRYDIKSKSLRKFLIETDKSNVLYSLNKNYYNWWASCNKFSQINYNDKIRLRYVPLTVYNLEQTYGTLLNAKGITKQTTVLLNILQFVTKKVDKIVESPNEIAIHFNEVKSLDNYEKLLEESRYQFLTSKLGLDGFSSNTIHHDSFTVSLED